MIQTINPIKLLVVLFVTGLSCLLGFLSPVFSEEETHEVPLFGLFEVSIQNDKSYDNPFTDVELHADFVSPSGRAVKFFGFYDGDGNGGQLGNVWKQRFMPDEIGVWRYTLMFSDGSPGKTGTFTTGSVGSKPGPWRQDPQNPRWFLQANGAHFLPKMFGVWAAFDPVDWQDAINWGVTKGFNTMMTPTLNTVYWGKGWSKNVTPFQTVNIEKRIVDYDRFNIAMWKEWDDLIQAAGAAGLYVAPWDGPAGDYGGQTGLGTVWPPEEFVYSPPFNESFDHPQNIRVIRYWIARQGAFWNLAFWNLYPGEIHEIPHYQNGDKVIAFGEYIASITPFGRLIGTQDIEQYEGGNLKEGINRTWLSKMKIPDVRKLNMTQVGPKSSPKYQQAVENNKFALDVTSRKFPVLGTETLWEGQPRAMKPLRIIWGSLLGGMHTLWADWSPEFGQESNFYWSLGKAWVPVHPLEQHVFQLDQLGNDTVGDEQLVIAIDALSRLEYWKMSPHNELVEGSTEAYCLAELGTQYVIYAPQGGVIHLDLTDVPEAFHVRWLDPRTGDYFDNYLGGGTIRKFTAPSKEDWVVFLTKS